ncbi:hypothetical protein P175DRAFT_0503253 [Aspergillus ochraceoroseus IBT 24754]|uniref:Uncharacterized protein n=1 Tax=Aspergillus ochraceoroseus IBT 24754 TaxID=1392256 RepID=A0A2T5LQA9_9EURO|nr:uncharacterized protein P175DRAFT_0503253 [Aspergillus ochraceoroseus IBT 24754]PTU18457.1 hypothetical protein P175DRAFT_0503253 [Aspergillus ochraceoroseus IBT 24754]
MTSRYPGRESPSPSRQSREEQEPFCSGHLRDEYDNTKRGQGPAQPREHASKASMSEQERQLAGLESNPVHPLEEIEARKFRKGVGN